MNTKSLSATPFLPACRQAWPLRKGRLEQRYITIKGARENNLKNIDLAIPRNKIVCFVGVSGSGKSTIAFDIIAREGQRQYFESLSSLARRYLSKSNRPQVDEIKGISPTIIISQDRVYPSPRSTVGTVTEAYTYLRLLYSRVGQPSFDSSYFSFNHPLGACPRCKGLGRAMEIDINRLVDENKSLNEGAILYSNWRVGSMWWKIIRATNYFEMDKKVKDYTTQEREKLLYAKKQVVIDKSGMDNVINWTFKGVVTHLLGRGTSVYRKANSEEVKYFRYVDCPECQGWRLRKESLAVKINGLNIGEVANMPISEAVNFIEKIDHRNATVIKPRLIEQLRYLTDAGIGYLSLNRQTNTLSGGEAQRVKLARQLGSDLIETIYVLDEPTAGLHPRDLEMVVKNLRRLRDGGNTVVVVEHDKTIIEAADYMVEVGPGGGKMGGKIVFAGTKDEFLRSETLTAQYLNPPPTPPLIKEGRKPINYLKIVNAKRNNLKNINVDIPLRMMVGLTGVSGAGKSSLVEEIKTQYPDLVTVINQRPIGHNRRACLATYVGVFDEIRKLFAIKCSESISKFSYNSQKGACEECKGLGFVDMDMNFLGEVRMRCDKCMGKRYKKEVLNFKYKNLNIAQVLAMTAIEANEFFESKVIKEGLKLLLEVGLDYLELGQTLDTLSGGEAQRLKLASRLKDAGEFLILDEPTSGLHFADVEKLLNLLNMMIDNGNTVLIIEHNTEVIKKMDWIIDLGPEGGKNGGEIVAQGRVEDIKKCEKSWTGRYL
ncbi:MAG: excinuclease ABC subunit UvrA [Candidatus Shapirobacteria bacterium]|jgi:excinuclease UvrABC ATPase subunit